VFPETHECLGFLEGLPAGLNSSIRARLLIILVTLVLVIAVKSGLAAVTSVQVSPFPSSSPSAAAYDIGSPSVRDVWVDPVSGDDGNSGDSRAQALQSLNEAWARVPSAATLTTGYRILLAAGDYPIINLPTDGWMASRLGSYQFPIILQGADGAHSARLHGPLTINDCHYLYIINLDFVTDPGSAGGGNVVHVSSSDHILIRGSKLDGFNGTARVPQETLKVNQAQYVYVEDSEIASAFWFPLDFVAVQYGSILNSSFHNAGEDCVVLKGGSAYFRIEGNEVYDCGAVGFSAGQGTGFEFMVSPWLHYEAYDLKFVNNVVHDTQNAGMAVRGGYNILLAYNTLFRIGIDATAGAPLLLVGHGFRSCDGDATACQSRLDAGGWGLSTVGESEEWIPNRNVYVYNNIFYNPSPARTMWSHFTIPGPVTPPLSSNIPSPSACDTNLQVRGNMIWNGPSDLFLGVGDVDQGCQPSNPTCNPTQLLADNAINLIEPHLLDPAHGNFRPSSDDMLSMVGRTTYAIPDFGWDDAPTTPRAPPGTPSNSVPNDRDGNMRAPTGPPGAYAVTGQQPTTTTTSATWSTTQVQTTTTSTQQQTTSSISTSSTSSGPASLSTTSTMPTTSTTTAESTSAAAPPGPGIPGFPIEAIVLGVILGAFVLSLSMLRRSSQSSK
jgi:hypothetical protein